jgi:GH18 family chitinase
VLLTLGIASTGPQADAWNYISADSARTQTYIDAVVGFANRHNYDGIDLDIEAPTDEPRMSRVIRIMHRDLSTWNPRGILVIEVRDGANPASVYSATLEDSVDQYNILGYDMVNIGGDVTAFNAPIYSPSQSRFPCLYLWQQNCQGILPGINNNAWSGARAFVAAGFKPSKVGQGMPSYGFAFPNKTPPEQPLAGSSRLFIKYETVLKALQSGGTYDREDSAKAQWVSGAATAGFGQWIWQTRPGQ